MEAKWKGGITMPPPGKYAFGVYELLDDEDSVIGTALVHPVPGGAWKVTFETDREVDLEKSTLVFVE